ncbi:MAG: phosphoribosylaminoimidazolesuccinocarboxamide synthase [Proteobacteria bacterium]|nr:phosphoribosylaminoimidazolesuccinocarboxamide synthase [Pseudomonadota bacterium]
MAQENLRADTVIETNLQGLKLSAKGKVRDIYDLGEHLLIIATDRISAFDVVLPDPIPFKGKVLNQISRFWFEKMGDMVSHHLVTTEVDDFPKALHKYREILEGRSMLVKKTNPLPVECVVRGYLSGSGWKEYQEGGSVSGVVLPPHLLESSKLPEPLFTPSTKAEIGTHDENINFEKVGKIIGKDLARRIKEISLEVYKKAVKIAENNGIIIADTKFEFGMKDGDLLLIDELLTPDSSRFWPRDQYEPGRPQASFDKQFVRDYLISINWDRKPPAPNLPEDIIVKTSEKYREAYRRLTGKELD